MLSTFSSVKYAQRETRKAQGNNKQILCNLINPRHWMSHVFALQSTNQKKKQTKKQPAKNTTKKTKPKIQKNQLNKQTIKIQTTQTPGTLEITLACNKKQPRILVNYFWLRKWRDLRLTKTSSSWTRCSESHTAKKSFLKVYSLSETCSVFGLSERLLHLHHRFQQAKHRKYN